VLFRSARGSACKAGGRDESMFDGDQREDHEDADRFGTREEKQQSREFE